MSEQTPVITGSFIWTLEDAKTRQDVLTRMPVTTKGKFTSYALTIILLVAALGLIVMRAGVRLRSFFSDPYLLLVVVLPLIVFYFVFRYNQSANLKKGFQQSPDSNKRIDIAVTHEEILIKAEGIYENKWQWGTIKEVQRNPKGFCFFLAEQAGIWIPMRAFPSKTEADSITELIRHLSQEMPSLKYREIA